MRLVRASLVLFLCLPMACAGAPAPGVSARPLELPKTTLTPHEQVTHLLNRAAFGPSPGDEADVTRVGIAAWLQTQLEPGNDPAIDHRLSGFKTLNLSVAQALEAYPPIQKRIKAMGLDPKTIGDDPDAKKKLRQMAIENGEELPKQLVVEATQARLIRAIQSRRQLEEVLVDFWFNHFNVSAEKNRTRWMFTAYERDAIRPHVLGHFRELLGATAKHPAMLWYLDNWQSVRDGFEMRRKEGMPRGLNENYARELMELHTLGVNAGYSQADVHEAARALTGWSVEFREKRPDFGTFVFRPMTHDSGEKQVFGLTIPANGGQRDGEVLLDHLARHPATAKHIAQALCERFVSDTPPPELVERIASIFIATDGDLRAVTQAIFESPEFWSRDAVDVKTKTPLEFVASAVRAVGTLDEVQQPLARALEQMGQPLYRCTPPTGYPDTANAWVSAGALVSRINFGIALASGKIPGVVVALPKASTDPQGTVDTISTRVLGHPPTAKTRATLLDALVAKEDDGEVKTLDPAVVAGLLLGSPEFQHQ